MIHFPFFPPPDPVSFTHWFAGFCQSASFPLSHQVLALAAAETVFHVHPTWILTALVSLSQYRLFSSATDNSILHYLTSASMGVQGYIPDSMFAIKDTRSPSLPWLQHSAVTWIFHPPPDGLSLHLCFHILCELPASFTCIMGPFQETCPAVTLSICTSSPVHPQPAELAPVLDPVSCL